MNYYREISFPVCASLQGLPAPFTFAFSPFSPVLQVAQNSSAQYPPHSNSMGEAKQGVNWTLKGEGGGLGELIHSFAPLAGFDTWDLGSKIKP